MGLSPATFPATNVSDGTMRIHIRLEMYQQCWSPHTFHLFPATKRTRVHVPGTPPVADDADLALGNQFVDQTVDLLVPPASNADLTNRGKSGSVGVTRDLRSSRRNARILEALPGLGRPSSSQS